MPDLEALPSEQEPGRRGHPQKNSDKLSLTLSYAAQAADNLGVNKRTVERDLRRGRDITPDVLAEVVGTDLDKGVVLDELRIDHYQSMSLDLVIGREPFLGFSL